MAEDKLIEAGKELSGIAIQGIKAFGIVLLIIVVLLVIASFADVALDVIANYVNFLVGLLP